MGVHYSVEPCGSRLGIGGRLDRRSSTPWSWRQCADWLRRPGPGCICRRYSALGSKEAAAQAPEGIDGASLERCLSTISLRVRPWNHGTYCFVRHLEASIRNFGHVDMMADSRDGCEVAVKRMPNTWLMSNPAEFAQKHRDAYEQPWMDIAVLMELNRCKFPNSCQLLSIFRDDSQTYVVETLAARGDLFAWCSSQEAELGPEREALVAPIASQTFSAVRCLHNLGVAHRDLSLENIMLAGSPDGTPQVKLIDFAMATASRFCRHEPRGKPSYQAPEMHTEAVYDSFLSDAFALGVCLFTLAMKGYPWDSTKKGDGDRRFQCVQRHGFKRLVELKRLKFDGVQRRIIDVLSPDLFELIGGLLECEPPMRFHLGEDCMVSEGKAWRSAWMSGWLQDPALAGLGRSPATSSTRSSGGDDDTDFSSD